MDTLAEAGAPIVNPYTTPADRAKFDSLSPEDQEWYTRGGQKPDLSDPYIAMRAPNKGKAVVTPSVMSPDKQDTKPVVKPQADDGHTAKLNALSLQLQDKLNSKKDTAQDTKPEGDVELYTIKPGDNLTRIARTFGTTIPEILKLNPQITNPNLIYAGKELKLPGAAKPEVNFESINLASGLMESFGYTSNEGAVNLVKGADIFGKGAVVGGGAEVVGLTHGNQPDNEIGLGGIAWDKNFIDGFSYTPADLALDLGITAISVVLSAGAGPAAPAAATAAVAANAPRIARVMKILRAFAGHAKKVAMSPKQFANGVKEIVTTARGWMSAGREFTNVLPDVVIGNAGFNTGMDAANDAKKALKKESLSESMGSMRDRLALLEGEGKVVRQAAGDAIDGVGNWLKKTFPSAEAEIKKSGADVKVSPTTTATPTKPAVTTPVRAKPITIKTVDGNVYKRDTQAQWHKVEKIKDPANASGKTAKMDTTVPVTDKELIRRLNKEADKRLAAAAAAETGKATTKPTTSSSEAGEAWWKAEQEQLKKLGLKEKPQLSSVEIAAINAGDVVVKQSIIRRYGSGFWAALVAGLLVYTGLKMIDGKKVEPVVTPPDADADVVTPPNTDVVKPGPDVVKPGPDVVKPGPNDKQDNKPDPEVEALIKQMQELMLGYETDESAEWKQATSNAQSLIDQARGSNNTAQIDSDKKAAREMPSSNSVQSTKPVSTTSRDVLQRSSNTSNPIKVEKGTVIGPR